MMSSLVLLALFGGSLAQFNSQGQNDILNVHNTLRSKIALGTYVAKGTKQPAGADLTKLKWCPTTAKSAQDYANTCPTGHSKTPGLGENLYWSWTTATIGDLNAYGAKASASWEKEFQDYGWTSNTLDSATFKSGIGHATQMAWAKTNLIGCGVKNCGPDASMKNMNKVSVVCQYKPPGNVMDTPIYKKGNTCSACPSGTKCESATGLCV